MNLTTKQLAWLSNLCLVLGFASIVASLAIMFFVRGDGTSEAIAQGQRWSIFVGLWVPSFWALSVRLSQYAHKTE